MATLEELHTAISQSIDKLGDTIQVAQHAHNTADELRGSYQNMSDTNRAEGAGIVVDRLDEAGQALQEAERKFNDAMTAYGALTN